VLTFWHWVAAGVLLLLLCGTRGAVRGGILILAVTFFTARVLYLWATSGN
jgi:hypothetical protein